MTAPALAPHGMRDFGSAGQMEALVAESAALVRSQVASVFGKPARGRARRAGVCAALVAGRRQRAALGT